MNNKISKLLQLEPLGVLKNILFYWNYGRIKKTFMENIFVYLHAQLNGSCWHFHMVDTLIKVKVHIVFKRWKSDEPYVYRCFHVFD